MSYTKHAPQSITERYLAIENNNPEFDNASLIWDKHIHAQKWHDNTDGEISFTYYSLNDIVNVLTAIKNNSYEY